MLKPRAFTGVHRMKQVTNILLGYSRGPGSNMPGDIYCVSSPPLFPKLPAHYQTIISSYISVEAKKKSLHTQAKR